MDVQGLIENVKNIRDSNIKHEELGQVNGFFEAQDAKEKTCNYILSILEQMKNIDDNNLMGLTEGFEISVNNYINQANNYISQINTIVPNGIHNPNYPNQRNQFTNWFTQQNQSGVRKELINIELFVKLSNLENKISNTDLTKVNEIVKKQVEDIKNYSTESQKILSNLHDLSSKKGIEEGINTFSKLSVNHTKREWAWFWAMVITGLGTIVLIAVALFVIDPLSNNEIRHVVGDYFKRFTLIIIPIIFFKVTMTKYNIERHLRITYDHRSTVLNQYKVFENAIGDDNESKNKFRIEIAKYIFSDPQTGFIKDTGSDLNINPIITMIEKLSPKS